MTQTILSDEKKILLRDIDLGFSQTPKKIPAKYLYDEMGAELYSEITHLPDYYLTNVEIDILDTYKNQIAAYIGDAPFNLIELGPGDGLKTKILLKHFLEKEMSFDYIPIDISKKYLTFLTQQFKSEMPTLSIQPLNIDYATGLSILSEKKERKNVLLFLGASIGNFAPNERALFFRTIWGSLQRADLILLGFDLCDDTVKLMRAYNDYLGLTREFNLNLLKRLNRELGANFVVEAFKHQAIYDATLNAMESYLVSLTPQSVYIPDLNKHFHFKAMENIHVESSFKFKLAQIQQLTIGFGFEVIQHFLNPEGDFVDSLWRVIK